MKIHFSLATTDTSLFDTISNERSSEEIQHEENDENFDYEFVVNWEDDV